MKYLITKKQLNTLKKSIKENIDKKDNVIYFFDFDGTLFDTPLPEEGKYIYKQKTGDEYPHNDEWWNKPESLDINIFDIKPLKNIYNEYLKVRNKGKTVLLTNRDISLKDSIMKILNKYNIILDKYTFKSDEREKPERILDIIKDKNINEINIYDDRDKEIELFKDFKKKYENDDLKININKIVNNNKNVLNEETNNMRNVVYTGVFLDDESKKQLLDKIKPKHENVFAHHSTIEFKPESLDIPLGNDYKLKVIGYVEDDKCQAVLVNNEFSKNKHPHITISCNNDTKPFYSNQLLDTNEIKMFDEPFYINSKIGYSDGKNVIFE